MIIKSYDNNSLILSWELLFDRLKIFAKVFVSKLVKIIRIIILFYFTELSVLSVTLIAGDGSLVNGPDGGIINGTKIPVINQQLPRILNLANAMKIISECAKEQIFKRILKIIYGEHILNGEFDTIVGPVVTKEEQIVFARDNNILPPIVCQMVKKRETIETREPIEEIEEVEVEEGENAEIRRVIEDKDIVIEITLRGDGSLLYEDRRWKSNDGILYLTLDTGEIPHFMFDPKKLYQVNELGEIETNGTIALYEPSIISSTRILNNINLVNDVTHEKAQVSINGIAYKGCLERNLPFF